MGVSDCEIQTLGRKECAVELERKKNIYISKGGRKKEGLLGIPDTRLLQVLKLQAKGVTKTPAGKKRGNNGNSERNFQLCKDRLC